MNQGNLSRTDAADDRKIWIEDSPEARLLYSLIDEAEAKIAKRERIANSEDSGT